MRETRMRYDTREVQDLLLAWILVAAAFSIAMYQSRENPDLALIALSAAVAAGLGFLLHELAHKALAIRLGASARFSANRGMLVFGLLLSFFGFIFLAPGGVHVSGTLSRKEHGKVAAGGPAANLILGALFGAGSFLVGGFWGALCSYGLLLNAWLAVFNLIPLPPFDGQKIWSWNKAAYVTMAVLGILLISVRML